MLQRFIPLAGGAKGNASVFKPIGLPMSRGVCGPMSVHSSALAGSAGSGAASADALVSGALSVPQAAVSKARVRIRILMMWAPVAG